MIKILDANNYKNSLALKPTTPLDDVLPYLILIDELFVLITLSKYTMPQRNQSYGINLPGYFSIMAD